jgi:1-deoxy-D-xylulose-5-phosphate reductoisomerase
MSAANEVAVAAFLVDEIQWWEIVDVVARVMDHYVDDPLDSIDALIANDAVARRLAHGIVQK